MLTVLKLKKKKFNQISSGITKLTPKVDNFIPYFQYYHFSTQFFVLFSERSRFSMQILPLQSTKINSSISQDDFNNHVTIDI